ncbi:MAG TPA: putative toxin-antitoxin system toxin component, PIN family [Terriglobia bacterium]|nr:putative toxin-antitoxin system toxin component, PIN family [Terriglobia bacterium]
MLALKLVLDTNVVVSAVLKPEGLERVALVFALSHPARLYVSPAIVEEYIAVLSRPQLKISALRAAEILDLMTSRAVITTPSRRLEVTLDPDDNVFLECAEEGRADYLVTGNKRHFPRFWKSTKIINARELLELIAPHLTP